MALVKFGGGVSEMRGKEAGLIFSRNAYGSYVKQKVSPVNPQSTRQQNFRGQFGTISQTWAGLSLSVKETWDNLGAQVTRVNRFGDTTAYTGFAVFMRLNRNRVLIGQSIITTAPVPSSITALTLTSITADISDTKIDLAFSPTVPSGFSMVVYSTPAIVTGRRFVKNYYRYLRTVAAGGTSPLDNWPAWTVYFGATPPVGSRIFMKAKLIEVATGFDGVEQVVVGTVTA